MVRWLPYAIMVACTPNAAPVEEGSAPAPTVVVTPPDAAIATVTPPVPAHAAFPSGFLATVGGPEDADFVVTTDTGGGIRLWPSLDGSREPVIIPSRATTRVEAIHDGDGIAIAVIDSIGQLEIVRTTRDGTVLERSPVSLSRPVIAVASTTHAFIAMLDDQRFDAFDVHGAGLGEVMPDPGVRVTRMLEGRGRVLALLDGKHVRARAFELGDGALAWGATSAPFAFDPSFTIPLSPDGTRIAGTRERDVVVIELATGKQIASSRAGLKVEGGPPSPIAFTDNNTLWITSDGHMHEWKLGSAPSASVPSAPQENVMLFAHVTAHALVWIENDELIVWKKKVQYLGFHMAQISDLVAAGDGWVGTDGSQVCHFDAQLAVDRMYPEPREQPFSGNTITLIDARHAVFAGYGKPQSVYELGSTDQPALMSTSGDRFQFERSTGIAEVDSNSKVEFALWDPATGAFGDMTAEIDRPESMEGIRLYNPAASSGLLAAYVSMPAPGYDVEVTSITKLDPWKSRDRTAAATKNVFRSESFFSQLDRFLPPNAVQSVSTDGTLVAELRDGRITLRDRDGNERWARTARGATGLAWNANDQLVAFGQGAAYVDLETGDFTGARCGWRFALWDKPMFIQGGAGMCTSDE